MVQINSYATTEEVFETMKDAAVASKMPSHGFSFASFCV